jgi:hypothetical protein
MWITEPRLLRNNPASGIEITDEGPLHALKARAVWGVTMRDEEAAAFARHVVSWFAGEIDRAVLETELVVAPVSLRVETARRNLLGVRHALFAIERAFAGVADEQVTGEMLAGRFCVQLVMGTLALSEWQAIESTRQRGQA